MADRAVDRSGKENGVVFYTARCVVSWLEFHVVARAENEIVHLDFSPDSLASAREKIQRIIPGAIFVEDVSLEARMGFLAGQYLCGALRRWPVVSSPLLVHSSTQFQRKVWKAIDNIAYGTTRTYGEIALAAGSPGAARAVGQACNANPLALITPCHRVVARDSVGGFSGGQDLKKRLLALEKNSYPP